VRTHERTTGLIILSGAENLHSCRFSLLSGLQLAPAVSAARQRSRSDRPLTRVQKPRVNHRAFECPFALRGGAPIERKGQTPRRAVQFLSTDRSLCVAETARAGGRLPFGTTASERRAARRRGSTQPREAVSARGWGARPHAAPPRLSADQSNRVRPESSCLCRCSIAAPLLD